MVVRPLSRPLHAQVVVEGFRRPGAAQRRAAAHEENARRRRAVVRRMLEEGVGTVDVGIASSSSSSSTAAEVGEVEGRDQGEGEFRGIFDKFILFAQRERHTAAKEGKGQGQGQGQVNDEAGTYHLRSRHRLGSRLALARAWASPVITVVRVSVKRVYLDISRVQMSA